MGKNSPGVVSLMFQDSGFYFPSNLGSITETQVGLGGHSDPYCYLAILGSLGDLAKQTKKPTSPAQCSDSVHL